MKRNRKRAALAMGVVGGVAPDDIQPYWALAMDGSYGSGRLSRDRWHSVMLGIGSTIRQVRRDSWWT
jgi:hypothetical protein